MTGVQVTALHRITALIRKVGTAQATDLEKIAGELRNAAAELRVAAAQGGCVSDEIHAVMRGYDKIAARRVALAAKIAASAPIRPRGAIVRVEMAENGGAPEAGAPSWGSARLHLDECELDGLQIKRRITDPQWRAGMIFRQMWLSAHPRQDYAARYRPRESRSGSKSGPQIARAHQLDAENAVRAAMAGMPERQSLALQAVAGEDEAVEGRILDLRGALSNLAALFSVPDDFRRREGL